MTVAEADGGVDITFHDGVGIFHPDRPVTRHNADYRLVRCRHSLPHFLSLREISKVTQFCRLGSADLSDNGGIRH